MKRTFLALAVAGLFFWSCGSSDAEANAEALKAEIEELESIESVLDQTTSEVDSARVELKNILNQLEE